MPRIVLNSCYGGFGLSEQAIQMIAARKGLVTVSDFDLERSDADLLAVVEQLGEGAAGQFARLRIADIPDDAEWFIDEYDGVETAREKHRTW